MALDITIYVQQNLHNNNCTYKILPTSAKALPRKNPGKMHFHIVTSVFYLPQQKNAEIRGLYVTTAQNEIINHAGFLPLRIQR